MISLYHLRNLRRRPVRSVLTVIGVAFAIALSTLMFSIGAGIRHSTSDILEEGGIDAYVIAQGGSIFLGAGYFEHGRSIGAGIDDHISVKHAIPVLYETIYISTGVDPTDINNVTDVSAMGIDPGLMGSFRAIDVTSPLHGHRIRGDALPTDWGDPFNNDWNIQGREGPWVTHTSNFTRELSVNEVVANKLGLKSGDHVYLSPTKDLFNAQRFNVERIVSPIPEYPWLKSVTLHLSELQYIKNLRNDTVNRIFLDLSSKADTGELRKEVEKEYSVSFIPIKELYNEIDSVTAVFDGYATLIILITFVVTVMFTSTILIISVRERMVELGALRAMGISIGSILKTVMAESFMISIIGLVIGLMIGAVMANTLDVFLQSLETGLPAGARFTLITPWILIETVGIALFVGLTAGLPPAYWITRLNITVVLKGD